jgi:hypothetical protein
VVSPSLAKVTPIEKTLRRSDPTFKALRVPELNAVNRANDEDVATQIREGACGRWNCEAALFVDLDIGRTRRPHSSAVASFGVTASAGLKNFTQLTRKFTGRP